MNDAIKTYLMLLNDLVWKLDNFQINYEEFLDDIYNLLVGVVEDIELSETDKLFLKVKIHKTAAEVL